MEYQPQKRGNAEDDLREAGRPTSVAPSAAPRSPMIVNMVKPLNQSWFPFRAARATPKAATTSARLPIVQRGGCIVILRWGITESYPPRHRRSTTCLEEEAIVPR
jgi:hypothetical protein